MDGVVFKITCNGEKASKLKEMGRYDSSADWITDDHFPIGLHPSVQCEIELFGFDHDPTNEEVFGEFGRRGLKCPTPEIALCFGAQHSDEQRKGPIVFLHESVLVPFCDQYVLVLDGDAWDRDLFLRWSGDGWGRICRFAGVRKSVPANRQA